MAPGAATADAPLKPVRRRERAPCGPLSALRADEEIEGLDGERDDGRLGHDPSL